MSTTEHTTRAKASPEALKGAALAALEHIPADEQAKFFIAGLIALIKLMPEDQRRVAVWAAFDDICTGNGIIDYLEDKIL